MLLPVGIKATVNTGDGGHATIERVSVEGNCRCGMPADLTDFIAFTSFDAQGNLKNTEIALL